MENIQIEKRDGRVVDFDKSKIVSAVLAAFRSIDHEITEYATTKADNIANYIADFAADIKKSEDRKLNVEEIQDLVQKGLMSLKRKEVAESFILYRNERAKARKNTIDDVVEQIVANSSDYWSTENSNKDSKLATTQRDYIAGAVSTDVSKRKLLPKHIVDAHEQSIIHFHDMDYFLQAIYNCCLINIKDMLTNGTIISKRFIDSPKKFSTASNVMTQIIAQVASSQYGGQSVSLAHLAPFVSRTREKFKRDYPTLDDSIIEQMVRKDIESGVQTIQYQILTLMTTNGQTPFITVYMNLAEVPEGPEREDLALIIEEVLKQRILGVKNEKGVYTAPAFPKLIYALDEMNAREGSKYYYLTKLAAECISKRMVPDLISNKKERELKNGDIFPCMGCRSFLTPDTCEENYANDNEWTKGHKYYGRFNAGVVTLNLVDVALSSGKDMGKFWQLLDERLELCHEALQCRHTRLRGTVSDIAPILWQNGAIARLEKGETIDKLLFNNYSTLSLGYAGIYEMTYYMLGVSHTTKEGKKFAKNVLSKLNESCNKWRAEENIGYSVYGTPLESTTYKFAKSLRKRFGVIPNVTDHNYITNSYHVNVREKIDAFSKLAIEAEYQELSPGGAISYVEVPNLNGNTKVILQLMEFIYENIMYAEINCKFDYCHECGYDGEILLKGDEGKRYWECPKCGNRNTNKMNITRRTCGYLGENLWNAGRTDEIYDRVYHLDF